MLQARFTLKSIAPMFFGKHVAEKKRDSETADQHERRTWQKKVHVDENGQLFIQPFALKNAFESAAKWLKRKIPGEGKATYTKRFVSGLLVTKPLALTNGDGKPITLDKVEPLDLFVPSDGVRGSGKRVPKVFPMLSNWTATGECIVLDEKINEDIFRDHLEAIGMFIGFGSMRVENGGTNGRFEVAEFETSEA